MLVASKTFRFVMAGKEGGLLTIDGPCLYSNLARSEDIWVGHLKGHDFLSPVSKAYANYELKERTHTFVIFPSSVISMDRIEGLPA